ncbi:MAG: DUF2207 family protein [Acidimicrobiales bacterium]
MRQLTRRKVDMAALALGALGLAGASAVGAAVGDGERVAHLWTAATLRDGSLQGGPSTADISEVIDYDFGVSARHGIFRDVPGLAVGAPVVVSSDSAPDEVLLTPTGGITRIRVGDPQRTISGRHRYSITYPLNSLLIRDAAARAASGEEQAGPMVAWNTVGTSWEVPIESVEAHVIAPFELLDARCSQGGFGSVDPCQFEASDPGHLRLRIGDLAPGEGVTVYATVGAPLPDPPTSPPPPTGDGADPGSGILPPATTALAAALIGAAVTSRLVRRAGRERVRAGGPADAAFARRHHSDTVPATETGPNAAIVPRPPTDTADETDTVPGAAIARLRPSDAEPGAEPGPTAMPPPSPGPPRPAVPEPFVPPHQSGPPSALPGAEQRLDLEALADLSTIEFTPPPQLDPTRGGIVLHERVGQQEKAAWLVNAANEGYLDFDPAVAKPTLVRLPRRDGPTTVVLDTAFAGRDRLQLGGYDASFARAWQALHHELEGWRKTSALWDPAADRRRVRCRISGVLAVLVGAVLAIAGAAAANRAGGAWLVLVAVGATLVGAGLAAAVRAWELRVRTVEGSALWLRLESFRRFLAESEASHVEQAARMGVLRQYTAWALALGEIERWSQAMAASGAVTDPVAANYARIAPTLGSAAATSTVKPSSGGSGGGRGGGGVGGGGGGGGGGSW